MFCSNSQHFCVSMFVSPLSLLFVQNLRRMCSQHKGKAGKHFDTIAFVFFYLFFFTWSWNIQTLYKRTISLITSRLAVLHARRIWPAFTVRTVDFIYYSGQTTSYHKMQLNVSYWRNDTINWTAELYNNLVWATAYWTTFILDIVLFFLLCVGWSKCVVLTEP